MDVCPPAWCSTAFPGKSRAGQLASAGRLTVGASLNARWFPASCIGHAGPPIVLFEQDRSDEADDGILIGGRYRAPRSASFPLRLVLHDEPAISGPPAVVGEAEEAKVSWTAQCSTKASLHFPKRHSQTSRE